MSGAVGRGRRGRESPAGLVIQRAFAFALTLSSFAGSPSAAHAAPSGPGEPPAEEAPAPAPAAASAEPSPPPASEAASTSEPALSPHPVAATEHGAPEAKEEPPQIVPKFATGFVMATGSAQTIPSTLPRNKFDYGLQGVAGIAAVGSHYEKWDYVAYIIAAVSADAVNGTGGSISPEQIALRFSPFKAFSLQAGYMRVPFSLAQSATITNAMFPTRPEPTQLFQAGADAGLLVGYEPASGIARVKAGLFDGLSLGLTIPQHVTRGPILSLFAEVSPLGGMKPMEADFGDSPFRFALSASMLYRGGTAYDPSGYSGLDVTDTRFTAALRAGYKGAFVQGEYLQAVQADSLSARPRISRGAYGEASYYVAIRKKLGLSPLARVGWSVQDESFYPLHIMTLHAGMAFYPRADVPDPSALRFVLQYRSERLVEERETGYGALLSAMLRF